MTKKEAIKLARQYVSVIRSGETGARRKYIVSHPAFLSQIDGPTMHSIQLTYHRALSCARREVAFVAAHLMGWGEAGYDAIIHSWLWGDDPLTVEQLLTKAKADLGHSEQYKNN